MHDHNKIETDSYKEDSFGYSTDIILVQESINGNGDANLRMNSAVTVKDL